MRCFLCLAPCSGSASAPAPAPVSASNASAQILLLLLSSCSSSSCKYSSTSKKTRRREWGVLRLVRWFSWCGAANCDIDFVFPAHDLMAVHSVITSDATAHRNTRNHLGESLPEAVDTPGNPSARFSNNYFPVARPVSFVIAFLFK